MKRIILHALCLPTDILAWTAVLLLYILWGKKLHFEKRSGTGAGTSWTMWVEFRENSWPMQTWYRKWGGTTFGHGGIYATNIPGIGDNWSLVQWHEHVHVEHVEAECITGFILGLISLIVVPWWAGLLLWTSMPLIVNAGRWIAAWLRDEGAYRGAFHEKAARAISTRYYQHGKQP